MKRKVIIAAATAVVLVGGGAATAVGVTSGSGGDQDAKTQSTSSNVRLAADDSDRDDASDKARDDDGRDDDGRDDDRDDSRDDRRDDDGDDGARDSADRDEDAGKAGVSVSEASQAILKATPGTITELELDGDDNRLVWEADVAGKDGSWHKVGIDASTGKVVKNGVDRDESDDQGATRGAKLDAVAAAAKAASATNGSVTSIDLERDGAKWEIDTVGKNGAEHEVNIDAATGKVLKHETEKADDGSDDADDTDDGSDRDDRSDSDDDN